MQPSTDPLERRTLNISSAIVYSQTGLDLRLREQLCELEGVQVHAASVDGKLVVTIERDSDRSAVDAYQAIERMPGVLAVAMIFQQTEDNPEQELLKCK